MDESQFMGVSFSQAVVKLLAIALRMRQDERDRDEELEQRPKELVVRECSSCEVSAEEQAEMDKILEAEPKEDLRKNKVEFKKGKE